MPTTETAIHKGVVGDLYLALGDRRVINGQVRWTFRAYYNPLIDLVFFGVMVMAVGGGLAVWKRPARRKAPTAEAQPVAAE